MLYVTWLKHNEIFDPAVHQQNDNAQILGLKVTHEEGGFAHAHILLTNAGVSEVLPEKAVIHYEKNGAQKILFSGYTVKSPMKTGDHCMTVTLTAESPRARDHLLFDQRPLKTLPSFDPLFVDDDHLDDLDEILEGYTKLPHWNRQGTFSFSELLEGSKTVEISENFDQASLKTRIVKRPLEQVEVHISAQWVQEYTGLVNLSPALIDALPEPFITTLTPKPVKKAWFRAGRVLPHTGYTVMQSMLVPFDPMTGGVSDRYPTVSSDFSVNDRAGDREGVRLPRSWFVPHLVMGINYRQKREESVHFTLSSSLQGLLPKETLGAERRITKKLRFKLQDIRRDLETPGWVKDRDYFFEDRAQYKGQVYVCVKDHHGSQQFHEDRANWAPLRVDKSPLQDRASPTYFLQPRGMQSILHALERARAYLAIGARVFETTFETDFYSVEDIDCDTSIRLKDPRFKRGEMVGKVVAYTLTFTHGVARAQITLRSTIGNPEILPEVVDDETGNLFETLSRIIIENPRAQMPEEGILDPKSLDGQALLENLTLVNSAEDQNTLLRGKKFGSLKEAEALINQHPTTITLDLKDLNSGEVLHHKITLNVVRPWSAPAQVWVE
jgi:hypothetical protein